MRLLVATTLVAGSLAAPALLSGRSVAADSPVREVVLTGASGTTLTTWPAYDASVDRFAARIGSETSEVRLTATSSDPGATIRVNGVDVDNGAPLPLPGLGPLDEVNVQITDAAGTSNQSWVLLPEGFPTMETATAGDGPDPGLAALTLNGSDGRSHATLVDHNGVPAVVLVNDAITSDFNRQPNGHFTLAVALTDDLWGDYAIQEYDEGFRKVATHRMVGHPKTDFHDTVLLPGGGRILMAYIKAPDGQTDSWLQEVAADGRILLDWNSRDHVDRVTDPIENALGDYAHLNSIDVMDDGNLLLSFRHLNQVMKIDRATGEVLWRLGGRRSTFTFPDDPLGGPCAQHTARELANGDIQVFDNGSAPSPTPSNPLCPDPEDPDGPTVYRPASRVTVYRLDPASSEARLVRSYPTDAFSQFAGGAQRLGSGTLDDHVFVGLNNAEQLDPPVYGPGEAPDAVELAADGSVVWTLTAQGSATYRAAKVDAPDRIPPSISVASPADGANIASGQHPVAAFQCTDTGGSNLDQCTASVANGAPLSREPGTHQVVVRASDTAGNTTTRTVNYTVGGSASSPTPDTTQPSASARARVDVMIRKRGHGWLGRETYSSLRSQTLAVRLRPGASTTLRVRIRNAGDAGARMRVSGSGGNRWITARWYAGTRDVTRRVRAGTYRTARLTPGEPATLRLVVTSRADAAHRRVTLRLAAWARDTSADVVRARVRTR